MITSEHYRNLQAIHTLSSYGTYILEDELRIDIIKFKGIYYAISENRIEFLYSELCGEFYKNTEYSLSSSYRPHKLFTYLVGRIPNLSLNSVHSQFVRCTSLSDTTIAEIIHAINDNKIIEKDISINIDNWIL